MAFVFHPSQYLGNRLIRLYNLRRYDITLDQLKSIYNIYITNENVNEQDKNGETMISRAVSLKEYDIVRFLVNIPGIELNYNYSLRNPLFIAIRNLDFSMINLLLSLNESGHPIIDVNVKMKLESPLFALYGWDNIDEEKYNKSKTH